MMTVSLREAHSSKHPISLAAVRSTFLLLILATLALCGAPSALAQSLTPGGPVNFGPVDLQQTATSVNLIFTAPPVTGTTITAITAVTEGLTGKDFKVVPGSDCLGTLNPHDTCTISLTFTPEQIGLRLGALTVTDSTNTVVNLVYLYGVGVGPQFVFQPATASAINTATTVGNFTPGSAVQDPNNNIIFLDVANNRILEESPATPPATPVFSQIYPVLPSTTSTLTLNNNSGLAIDGTGTLYVSSGTSVYFLAPGATTFTVVPITGGVTLKSPAGLAVDPFGDLYIADTGNNAVYLVPEGGGPASALPLTGLTAPPTLSGPTGLAVNEVNNQITLYIADSGNNRIVAISLNGVPAATVLTLNTLTLNNPTGVGVDAAGTVYIADTGNKRIIEATATVPSNQFVLATVPTFTLDNPVGVLTDVSTGNVVVSDTTLGLVTFVRTTAAVNFPTSTEVGTPDTTDDPQTLTVQGTGNIQSTLSGSFGGADPTAFQLAPNPPSTCPPPGTFDIGEVCVYDLNFQPTVVGPNLANLVLTAAAAGVAPSSNTASLKGTGFTTLTHFSLVAISTPPTTPTNVYLGGSVELVLTALNSSGTVAKDYSGNITFTTTDANGLYFGGTPASSNTVTYNLTAADNGVLTILNIPGPPPSSGLQLNAYGVWTATATVTDPATLPPTVISDTATSNPIYVIEPSTLKLTSSVNPSLINQSTTFTLTITTTGTIPPAGTVDFYNGANLIGTATVVSTSATTGTATINDSFPAAGTYPISASYYSTSNTADGTATLSQVVGNAASVSLTSSINPSTVGQSTNLIATITSNPIFGAVTGTVQFFDGATSLGTVAVSGSTATLPVSFATAGNHTLTAVYTSTNPDLTNATSGPYIQHVLNLASLILTSSVNPSTPGQSTTLTATLSTLTTTPGGTIKFYDGTTLIGTVTLPTNSVSVSFTTPGNHILTAVYSGDATTETITSPPLTQVVLYVTTATLTSSVNPVNVNANTTLSATVHSTTGTPTGTVTFKSNGITIGTGTLSGGVATLVTSFNLPGTYTLVATYGGDANNQPATTNTVVETVINVVSLGLTSSVNPVFLDNPTVLTATLTTAAGTTPTGTVNFLDGTTPIGSGTIVNGMASITASFVYAGPHSLTAVYAGDAQDAPATSPVFTQTVADFSLTIATGGSSSASIIAAGSATYNLVVTPLITSTLPGPITLTVTGLPTTVTGTLTPTTIATGSGTTPVAFAVTAASLLQVGHVQHPPTRHSPLRYAPITFALLALPLAWFRRRQRFASLLASILLLFAVTVGLSGCAGPANTGYYGETPQTYNLTVTATSGNLSRSTYLTLTVQ
jgi:sugar lactone lactonase YvrE